MSDANKTFYNEIGEIRKKETLEFLVHNQTVITLKSGTQYRRSKVSGIQEKRLLVESFPQALIESSEVVCSFEIKGDKYFFNTIISVVHGKTYLQLPASIFQLQRRNDFRVSIPVTVSYTCLITHVDLKTAKVPAEIRDISLGGCQLVVKKSDLNVERIDQLVFHLKIREFERTAIKCEARHVMLLQNDSKLQIGAKFLDTDSEFQADLFSLLVQLDRIHRGKTQE